MDNRRPLEVHRTNGDSHGSSQSGHKPTFAVPLPPGEKHRSGMKTNGTYAKSKGESNDPTSSGLMGPPMAPPAAAGHSSSTQQTQSGRRSIRFSDDGKGGAR